MPITAKFGGSSLAGADRFRAVRRLLAHDPSRKAVVVSAPGRRFAGDLKLTDLLYACFELRRAGGDWRGAFYAVAERFEAIRRELSLPASLTLPLEALERGLSGGTLTREYVASRGEYFSARLLAAHLGWRFLDSADWLRFLPDGRVDTAASYALLRQAETPFVTPGFYGAEASGAIRTFPRGGSDITGALAAAALDAELYENWTDVPGVLTADPAAVPSAAPVPYLTYGELTALGAQVLHPDAVLPVQEKGIPLRIASSFAPEKPGTWISSSVPQGVTRDRILSVSLRPDGVLILFAAERGVPEIPGALRTGAHTLLLPVSPQEAADAARRILAAP